ARDEPPVARITVHVAAGLGMTTTSPSWPYASTVTSTASPAGRATRCADPGLTDTPGTIVGDEPKRSTTRFRSTLVPGGRSLRRTSSPAPDGPSTARAAPAASLSGRVGSCHPGGTRPATPEAPARVVAARVMAPGAAAPMP